MERNTGAYRASKVVLYTLSKGGGYQNRTRGKGWMVADDETSASHDHSVSLRYQEVQYEAAIASAMPEFT